MPFTKFTNLDFDQIKTSIKDYIRANSDFTDFDFEGSNFSVLIDTLAYNTYITAFNSNMIVNESLDSATVRENVVSLARSIGYVPRSRTAARANVTFTANTTSSTPTHTLQAGLLVCTGVKEDTTYVFSTPESITTTTSEITDRGKCNLWNFYLCPITLYQGTYLTKTFTVDGSLDQRFILENSYIDTSTINVYVKGISDAGHGREYRKVTIF